MIWLWVILYAMVAFGTVIVVHFHVKACISRHEATEAKQVVETLVDKFEEALRDDWTTKSEVAYWREVEELIEEIKAD